MPRLVPNFLTAILLATATTIVQGAESAGTVLITGANRGIGLAMSSKFSEEGYSVIGTARRPEEAIALRRLPVRVVQLDVTAPGSVAALAEQLGD